MKKISIGSTLFTRAQAHRYINRLREADNRRFEGLAASIEDRARRVFYPERSVWHYEVPGSAEEVVTWTDAPDWEGGFYTIARNKRTRDNIFISIPVATKSAAKHQAYNWSRDPDGTYRFYAAEEAKDELAAERP